MTFYRRKLFIGGQDSFPAHFLSLNFESIKIDLPGGSGMGWRVYSVIPLSPKGINNFLDIQTKFVVYFVYLQKFVNYARRLSKKFADFCKKFN